MSLSPRIIVGWMDGLIKKDETYYLVLYRRDMREEVTYNHWWQRLLRRPSFTRRIPTDVVDTKAGRTPLTVASRTAFGVTFEDVPFHKKLPNGTYSSPSLSGCYVGVGIEDKDGLELMRTDFFSPRIVQSGDEFLVTTLGITISS